MRDFRERVIPRQPDNSEIIEALRKGQLEKALRKARAAGTVVCQAEIDGAAKAMLRMGRAGALLAMVGKVDVCLPFDIETLLCRTYEAKDYHTFLKQVHRLGLAEEQQRRVQAAIEAVQRKAPREAMAWRRKFGVGRTDPD